MRPVRRVFAFATSASLAAALVLAGCGDDDDAPAGDASAETDAGGGSGGESGGSAAQGDAVEIVDFEYTPADLTVAAGTEITFTNGDGTAHTATSRDNAFDSGSIAGGETGSITVEDAGTYTYFCSFHPFMEATLTVE